MKRADVLVYATADLLAGLLAVFILCSVVPREKANAAETPKTIPAASELLVEAEDFHVDSGFRVIGLDENYYAATLSNTFISRQKLLSAPEQLNRPAAAHKDVIIPADGRYRIWTRYENPSHFSAEHGVRIEQAGKTVFDRLYGTLANPKLWAFGKGLQPMVEQSWGSGDDIVWEPSSELIALKKGPARIVLSAGAQPADPSMVDRGLARRNIDAVYLTTDGEFGLDHPEKETWLLLDKVLNQKGECYLRITNPASATVPIVVKPEVITHSPYWRARGKPVEFISKTGDKKPESDADYLKPGEASPFVAIGQALDSTNMQELGLTAVYKIAKGQKAPAGSHFIVELARDPAGQKPLRKLEWQHPELTTVYLEIPPDLRERHGVRDHADKVPLIRTLNEWQRELRDFLASLPPRGPFPVLTPVYSIVGGPWSRLKVGPEDEFSRLRDETGLLLGRNTWEKGKVAPELMAKYKMEYRHNLSTWARGVSVGEVPAHIAQVRTDGVFDQTAIFDLGDELSLPRYGEASKKDEEEFAQYLAEKNVPANDNANGGTGAGIHLTTDSSDDKKSIYWSARFWTDRAVGTWRAITQALEKAVPGVHTGANFSPHPDYWPISSQWFDVFRGHGLTSPWTEDWVFQVPEASSLSTAYLCDVLRGAGAPEHMPIQLYNITNAPGQTPRDLTLSFYSGIAHGNKLLNFFGAVPIYDYSENYTEWNARENWKTIRDLVADVGVADELVAHGTVRRAEVAMVVSFTNDLWERARHSSIYNFERKNVYYALRHAQIPVDFISEDDLAAKDSANDLLKGVRVIVLTGDHLHSRAAEGLKRFVAGGGTLISVAGGGLRNEYDEPQGALLHPLYGIESAALSLSESRCFVKEGLAWLKPMAEIKTKNAEGVMETVPALAALQVLHPSAGARVLERFGDGHPAVVENSYEKGKAVLMGFFPGTAYMQKAIPKRPFDRGSTDQGFDHFLPVDFNHAAANLLLSRIWDAGVHRPVFATTEGAATDDKLQPLDATVIDAPEGVLVTIANYSGKPIAALTVSVDAPAELTHAHAARAGDLPVRREAGRTLVTLPIDWADLITFRK